MALAASFVTKTSSGGFGWGAASANIPLDNTSANSAIAEPKIIVLLVIGYENGLG